MFLLKLIAVYLPFEELILKWLPVSDQIYQLLRQLPDAMVFCLMVVLLLSKLSSGKLRIIGQNADVFLFFFLVWVFIAILLNPAADAFIGIANIKALLRYVLLIYILLIINPSDSQIASTTKWVSISIIGQAVVGLVQFVGGLPVRDFLAARRVTEGVMGIKKVFTGDKFEGINHLMGAMGDNISFAYFMLVGLVILLFSTKFNSLCYWIGCVILCVLIFLSNSRAATIASVLCIFSHSVVCVGWAATLNRMTMAGIVLLPVGLFILLGDVIGSFEEDKRSFFYIFNANYLHGALNQRLGIVVYLIPEIVSNVHGLIGYGPDKYHFSEVVWKNPMMPRVFAGHIEHVIEDVYWVAMLAYYGAVGLLFWIGFLLGVKMQLDKLMKLAVGFSLMPYYRLGGIAIFLLLASVLLNFFNPAFEVRCLSFYLWLFCGLALVGLRRFKTIISNAEI